MAVEEEGIVFLMEADGSSALEAMDELDASMQSLSEQITQLAETAGDLSALDDAFMSLLDGASQAEQALAGLTEGLDALLSSSGEAAAGLEEVAAAAGSLGDASGAGIESLDAALVGTDEAVAAVSGALAEADAAFAGVDEAISSSSMALVVWQDAAASVEAALTSLEGEFVAADEAMAAAGEAATALDAEFSVLSETMGAAADGAIAGVKVAIEDVGTAAEATAAKVDTLGNSEEVATEKTAATKDAMAGAQMQLMMVGAVLVMVAGNFLSMGSKAEDAFAQIQGLAGANASQMEQYKSSLQGMAVQFGTSLDQAANGLYYVISAGYSGSAATTVLSNAMKAAAAGGVQMQVTASALTSILNSYGAGADKAQQYTDLMTEAVVQGKQSYSDLSNAIGAAAVTGHAVGISFDQVAASEADLTRSGMDAHKAVMDLDFMLRAVALGGGSQAAATAKKLGLSFDQTKYSSMSLIDKLNYLQTISKGNQADFEKLVGGANGFLAAQVLLTNETGNYDSILDAMHHSLGATDQAFQVSQQTISAALGHVKGALSDVAYQLVEMIQPAVGPMLNGLAVAFQFLGDHIDAFKPIIVGLTIFLASVFIPVLWGMAAPILAAFAPFAPVAAILAGVGVALVALYQHFAPFRDMVQAVGNAFSQFASTVSNAFDLVQRKSEESTLQTKLNTVNTTIQQKQELLNQYRDQAYEIETQMNHTENSVEKHALAMKLKAINAAEKQTQGVIDQAKKQREGVQAELEKIDPVVEMHTLRQKDTAITNSLVQSQRTVENMVRTRQGLEQELSKTTDSTKKHTLETQIAAIDHAIKQKDGVIKQMELQKQGVEKQMKDTQQAINKDAQSNVLINMWKGIQQAAGNFGSFMQKNVLPILGQIGGFLRDNFMPVWQNMQHVWNDQLVPAGHQIAQAFGQIWTALQPLAPVLKAIGMLFGVTLLGAFTIFVGLLSGIALAIANIANDIASAIGGIAQFIGGLFKAIGGIIQFFIDLCTGHFDKLGADLGQIWDGIKQMIGGVFQFLGSLVHAVFGSIGAFISGFAQGVANTIGRMFGFATSEAEQTKTKVELAHQEMALKSEQHTQEMAQKNIQNLEHEKQGVLLQLAHCKNESERHRLEMKLSAISNAEKQEVGVVNKAKEEKEKTLQHIKELKEKYIEEHKSMLEKAWDWVRNGVGHIFDTIGTFVHNLIMKAEEMRQQFIDKAEQLRTQFINKVQDLINQVISTLQSLPGKAIKVIEDMISGMGNAITGGIGKLAGQAGNLASSIASTISSHLHFSVPDVGPLRDAPNWMPDMMELFSQGITANQGKLQAALKGLGLSMQATLQPTLTVPSLPGGVPGQFGAATSLLAAPTLPTLSQFAPPAPVAQSGAFESPASQQLLTQILGVLQRLANNQQATQSITMNNTISSPAASTPQQLLNILLAMGGNQYQSLQRGSNGL